MRKLLQFDPLTFDNADYYVDKDAYEHTFSHCDLAQSEAPKDEFLAVHSRLLVLDRHGIFVPQVFAGNFDAKAWNIDENSPDFRSILSGPDENEWYWEAWNNIINEAYHIDEQGLKWTLEQDGDLYAKTYIEFKGEN